MKFSFLDYLYLGAEHWRTQPNPFVKLFFLLFGPLGISNRIRNARLISGLVDLDLNDKYLLDTGCGLAYALFWLEKKFPRANLTGLEIDQETFQKNKFVSRATQSNIQFVKCPIEMLPESRMYDVIISADVLEHIEDDTGVLREMKKRLAPEGRVILHLPYRHQLQQRIFPQFKQHTISDHVRDEYTDDEIVEKLHMTGFSIDKLVHGYGWFGELSFELNNLFWHVPVLRHFFALLFFPVALIAGYFDIQNEYEQGNSIFILASHADAKKH